MFEWWCLIIDKCGYNGLFLLKFFDNGMLFNKKKDIIECN